jgi:hypothetical protein
MGVTFRDPQGGISGPLNIGGEVTPGGGKRCSDAKSAVLVKNVRIRTNLPTKGQNLFGQDSKIRILKNIIFREPRGRKTGRKRCI